MKEGFILKKVGIDQIRVNERSEEAFFESLEDIRSKLDVIDTRKINESTLNSFISVSVFSYLLDRSLKQFTLEKTLNYTLKEDGRGGLLKIFVTRDQTDFARIVIVSSFPIRKDEVKKFDQDLIKENKGKYSVYEMYVLDVDSR